MKKHIPNLLTLGNLFCGCLGCFYIASIINYPYDLIENKIWLFVGCLTLLSLLFDFADGMTARLWNIESKIGRPLDSLADMVSFGLLPGFIMMFLIHRSLDCNTSFILTFSKLDITNPVSFSYELIGLLIPLFSAIRLAKFTIDKTQNHYFKGLAAPANTLFILSLLWVEVFDSKSFLSPLINNLWALIFTTLASCGLLVSNLPMFSFKIKNFSFLDNIYQYMLLIIAVILIITLKIAGLPFIIISYIALSIIFSRRFL